jgi:hypothetical protein
MTHSYVKIKNGIIKTDRKTDRKTVKDDIFVRKDKERQSTS